MKCFIPVMLLLATACTETENSFTVTDQEGLLAGAQVELCGAKFPLRRTTGGFSGRVPITCEGDGKVVLHISDGRETQCLVGYVTPGAIQDFEFVADDAGCAPEQANR